MAITINMAGRAALRLICASESRSLACEPWLADGHGSDDTGEAALTERPSATIDVSGVTSPGPNDIYKGGWWTDGTDIDYVINGLNTAQTYRVVLHFCAPTGAVEGDYVVNAAIDGATSETPLSAQDLVTLAGAADAAYATTTSMVPDANGEIAITVDTTSDEAVLCGIEVIAIPNAFTSHGISFSESPGSFTSHGISFSRSPGSFN